MRIVVVGGGAGGVELALAMHSQLRNEAEFTIIHAGPHLLPPDTIRARAGIVDSLLCARRVTVVKGRRVVEVMQDRIRLDGGETLAADFVFWAA